MSFLKLTSDFAFKTLFIRSPDLLVDLVNSVLEITSENYIKKLNILNPEILKETLKDRKSILDIKAKDENENVINIEMQDRSRNYLLKRFIFYLTKIYSGQLKEGESYIKLKKAFSINFLNFNFSLLKSNVSYNSFFCLMGRAKPNILLTEDFGIHFIELLKFKKKSTDITNKLETWIYVIKNSSNLTEDDMSTIIEKNPKMEKTFQELETISRDKDVWNDYEERQKILKDQIAYDEEIAESKQEGIEKGEMKKALVVAKKMLEDKISIEDICKYTGLTKEDLEKEGII